MTRPAPAVSGARTAPAPGTAPPRPGREPGLPQLIPPVALAAAAGIVGFLGAVLLWRPPAAPLAEITGAGTVNVMPEHDVALYLGMGMACLLFIAFLAVFGGPRRDGAASPSATLVRAGVATAGAGAAVLASIATFAHARNRLPAGPRVRASELAFFAVVAAGLAVAAWALAPRRPASPASASAGPAGVPPARWHPADLVVPLALVAIVYVPGWRLLAGNAFSGEEFLHIDFFAIGPALAFSKGLALGTDVHAYYGMGWAIALTKLPLVRTLSHGHFIRLEVIYGCIYFTAVYAFLRLFTRRWQWAVSGTALAFLLQLFGSYSSAFIMWRFPSATVLRWAFDIWFFLTCLAYLRTHRERWLVAGGVLVGLAILFQTDTGIYLGLSAAFFWCCLLSIERDSVRRLVRAGAMAAAGGLAVLVLGLGVASRWTLTDQAFWDGWLENLRQTRAGATLLPLVAIEGQRVLIFFALMIAVYLSAAGYTLFVAVHRRLGPDALLLGTVAVYGFLTLLYFVGRSNPHNLFRPAVPFAIVLAGAATVLRSSGPGSGGARARTARALPWAVMALAITMLVAHPGFRNYPSLAKTAFTGSEPEGLCMPRNPDICGIDAHLAPYIDQLQALSDRLRDVAGPDDRVAMLDTMGPLVHVMADVRPWGRYIPLFPAVFFNSMVDDIAEDLESSPPDIVVMRSRALHNPFHEEVWQAIRPTVEREYTLDSDFGPFEVWQRRVAGLASGREGTT